MPPPKLRVIPDPGYERSTMQREGDGTVVFRGSRTGLSHVCGACGAVLLEGIAGSHVIDLVLRCNGCDAYNESPTLTTHHLAGKHIIGPVLVPVGRYPILREQVIQDGTVLASEQALGGDPAGSRRRFNA